MVRKAGLVLLCALAVALAACSRPPAGAPQGGGSAGPTVVKVTHWQHHDDARRAVLEQLAKDFMAQNPGITIELQTIPYAEYFDKLLSALAGQQGPDVFQIPLTMVQEFIASGTIAPIPDSVMSLQQAQELYIPWTIELAQRDGKLYGVPTDVQTLVMFINEDLARQAGLDPANPPTTWPQLAEQAARATKRDANGNIVQAGLDTRYKWAVYNLLLTQAVDPVVDFAAKKVNYDTPEGIRAWQMVHELMVRRGVDSPQFLPGQRKWEQGKAVFYINHPVARRRPAIAQAPFPWRLTHVPRWDDTSPLRVPGHSWLYVVNARAAHQEAAARWATFLASEHAVRKWAVDAGDLPALKSLLNDPSLAATEMDRLVLETMQYAVPVRQAGAKDVDDIRDRIWDCIVLQAAPVEQCVREGAAAENALMQRKLGQ